MNKWTKEEISLCKQVAEKYRKDIEYGSWYIEPKTQKGVLLWDYEDTPYFIGDQCSDTVPLWTISDCLDFLAERGLWIIGFQQDENEWSVGFAETDELGMRAIEETQKWEDGNTPLEACLKAVLAVLEEKK